MRDDADLDKCVELAQVVHQVDGYPYYLPGDLREFLAARGATAAWVAESDREVVGHVALHSWSSAAVMSLASHVSGQPAERLGFVARLLVAPASRRQGIGRSLLLTATDHAVARGLWPVLDVAVHHDTAIALYEKCGWVRVGEVFVRFGHGGGLDEFVYFGPTLGKQENLE